jgi:hypothetical protein
MNDTDVTNVMELGDQTNHALPLRKDPVVTLCEWFGRLIGIQVPVGCEDEAGFHYETKPASNESSHSFNI